MDVKIIVSALFYALIGWDILLARFVLAHASPLSSIDSLGSVDALSTTAPERASSTSGAATASLVSSPTSLGLLVNTSFRVNSRVRTEDDDIGDEDEMEDDASTRSSRNSDGEARISNVGSIDDVENGGNNDKNYRKDGESKISKSNGQIFDNQIKQQGCKISEFRCLNGTCISLAKFCDGSSDCSDRSDEPNQCSGNQNRVFFVAMF